MQNPFENPLNLNKPIKEVLPVETVGYTEEEKQALLDFEKFLSIGNIGSAIEIKKKFPDVDFSVQAKKAFERNRLGGMLEIKLYFPDVDFSEQAQKVFEDRLLDKNTNDALEIKEIFPDVDFSEQAQKVFEHRLSNGDIGDALEIQKIFPNIDLTRPEVRESAQKGFEKCLSEGFLGYASKIQEKFPDIDLTRPEVRESAQRSFKKYLSEGRLVAVLKIQEEFPNFNFIIPKVTESAQKSFEKYLSEGRLVDVSTIQEKFPNIDFTESAQKVFENFLSEGEINDFLKIQEKFPGIDLTRPKVTESAQKSFEKYLLKVWLVDAARIKENFKNIDFTESAQKVFENFLSEGEINDALKIKENFKNIDFTESAQKVFEKNLLNGKIKNALKIKENFPNIDLTKSEVTEVAQKVFEKKLLGGAIDDALEIKENFPNIDLTKPEIVAIAQKIVEDKLSEGYIESKLCIDIVFKIQKIFPKVDFTEQIEKSFGNILSDYDFSTFSDSLLILKNFKIPNALEIINSNLKIKEYIEFLKKELPDILKDSKEENPEYILKLYLNNKSFYYAIENKEKYPWLSDAILGNDRFSDKLISQFEKLDKLSRKNIDLLFKTKENIIANNPIDENSPEFRILMQDALKEYRSNPEILEYIKELGVDTDAWLNYDKEEHIRLGKGEDLSFAEMVKTPVIRMEETFTKYKISFKETFGEYQKELQDYKIPLESVDELVKSIDEMNSRIKEAEDKGEDERKIQGMKKGLENLQARKDNPKLAPLWQKVLSDFDSIVVLSNDIQKIHNTLAENEDKYKLLNNKEKLEAKERNDLFNYKKVIGKSINEFKDKLNLLEKRMLAFDENLPELVKPCLGEDRTVSLIQEFKENTHEVLDHFNSDVSGSKSSLDQVLGEQEKNKLEGRFVKIGLWGRNPDRDLYLGNYTNCCIRIDSEHMDEESTIADYLTDTGMQVVTIVDEITNEPVVAAWVYIGENNGQPKMVIDNIEANRDYVNYFNTFKESLEKYFVDYAEKTNIGSKNISQGVNNNDIELNVELGDLYYKAGGYNRKDGYFLEAEPDDEEEYEDYENE